MDRKIYGDGFAAGVSITFLLFELFWIASSSPVHQTADGKFYIKTHGQVYQLVSDKSVEIKKVIE